MPRQIIDTETSRPAYVRRLAIRWVAIVLLVLAVLILGFVAWRANQPHVQGKAAAQVNQALFLIGDVDAA
jgi:lipopolysaccharide export system protein LptC